VEIAQSLGGDFTVTTDDGGLFRIAGKDADALGLEPSAAPAAAVEGPFDAQKVWEQLKTVFDPEIPVNLVDLGLIYRCEAVPLPDGSHRVEIDMSMTAPGCGMGDVLKEDVRRKIQGLPGVREVRVEVVWDPPWDQSRMSDAARLQLGWM
jgi:probable FeS assembly SUF system protein SufT